MWVRVPPCPQIMALSKILVILGPTASGKSALAVKLARKFNGEIISADSRQVYKGLDIGTGKITKREMKGIPHYLLDVLSPKKVFTAEQFRVKANEVIDNILERGKLPIICGGTGFYIQAIVDNVKFPDVPPNKKLRLQLEKLSAEKLLHKLANLDPARAKNIDPHNKRRIIRAIEIATALGKVPPIKKMGYSIADHPRYNFLQIGIELPRDVLRKRIHDRLLARMKKGMVAEAQKLHTGGLPSKRMENLGLEYRYLARFLTGKISKSEMLRDLEKEIWHYARRQMTWFRGDKRIKWFAVSKTEKIESVVISFFRK